ncbi:MAG: hypothetical protein M0T77_03350 [Actinomycetota bacterium]|nr:hypothetical protein [Actinomycetota bacterium]
MTSRSATEAVRASNLPIAAPDCSSGPGGTGDREIARLAERQHGHVHLYQLRAAGIGRNALAHRVRTGRLHVTLPGVHLVGRPSSDIHGRMMAAVLQLRGDGLISARTAAQLWGMIDTTQLLQAGDPIDVLVVGGSARIDHGAAKEPHARL